MMRIGRYANEGTIVALIATGVAAVLLFSLVMSAHAQSTPSKAEDSRRPSIAGTVNSAATGSSYMVSSADAESGIEIQAMLSDEDGYAATVTGNATPFMSGHTLDQRTQALPPTIMFRRADPQRARANGEDDVTLVPASWFLLPEGFVIGDEFRLLFLTSTKHDASSLVIGVYNTFIVDRAAAGHDDIQHYSSGFRVVGCTQAVDARDNTSTTYTNRDKGVPIYWLGGAKVADDYEDFYDGDWDDEANDKNESGNNGPNTSVAANYPFTGCKNNGTEDTTGTDIKTLGGSNNVTVGRPSTVGSGPIGSNFTASSSDTRPFYGLSAVFKVASDDATLSDLAINNDRGAAIMLTPAFTSGTINYSASILHRVDEITIIPTVNDDDATYEIQDGSGTALVDANAGEDGFQVALLEGLNTVKVEVTAPDTTTTGTYTLAAVRDKAPTPAGWSLIPDALNGGDKFRLLFISSTKRDASSSNIGDYNTFVQNRAAAGHADIQAYSSGFRVVGCTQAVDARDNTGTTHTSSDKGVPICWLDGAKVADHYADFYDGPWDDELNVKDESGEDGLSLTLFTNLPLTGCANNGTELFAGSDSQALGSGGDIGIGRPTYTNGGPIDGNETVGPSDVRPIYGLSEVFQAPYDDAALSGLALEDDSGDVVALTPAFASGTSNYSAAVARGVDEIRIIPTVNQDNATYEFQDGSGTALVDANPDEDDFRVEISEGAFILWVVVTAQDTRVKRTYTVVISPPPTKVAADWGLKPSNRGIGHKFRLLFLSSTKRDATSSNIADYNTFVQGLAATGHTAIQSYSSGFRVVGCTPTIDARDNTGTTYTASDQGVRIYWLNGVKVADHYEDFYDGDWDNETNDKNASGTNGPDTAQIENRPFTGCENDGTEAGDSQALGNSGDVRLGAPGGILAIQGPISGSADSASDDRPFYGLSAVFLVVSDDATLSDLTINDGTNDLILDPGFASGTHEYAAEVTHAIDTVTLSAAATHGGAEISGVTLAGAAIADTDFTDGITVPSLLLGDNVIVVTVTAENESTTQTYQATVTRLPSSEVPLGWSLKPAELGTGDQFRLLFLSSTKRDGSSANIADYNTFIRERAAAGHADIKSISTLFKVVGCTDDVDARDNTRTTHTSSDKGVPIYWLNGGKVAADYEDFYDGSWDEEVNDKDELGNDGPDTSQSPNYPLTGCFNNGTQASLGADSLALGAATVRVGRPDTTGSESPGPLSGSNTVLASATRPMYEISEVFHIPASNDATLSGLTVNDGFSDLTLDPVFASGTYEYAAEVEHAVDTVTLTATLNHDRAEVSGVTLGGAAIADTDFTDGITVPSLLVGDNEIVVTVTAQDTDTTLTYTVTVTRPIAEPGSVLVSNLSAGSNLGSTRSATIAQRFTTGSNADGYSLTSVEVVYADMQGDTFSAKVCTVTGSDQPTSTCTELTPPTTFAEGPISFTVARGIALAASKKYAVVMTPAAGATVTYAATGSDTEDSNSLDEWIIAPEYRYESSGTWETDASSSALRMLIRGSVNTESNDATLSALSVNDGTNNLTLDPTFASDKYVYAADVGNDVDALTLTATATHDEVEVTGVTLGGTAVADTDFTDGITVPALAVGANEIIITVTAEDATISQTYTLTVTRAAVSVSVSFEQGTYTVAEGASVTVKVKLSADPERTVTIPITKANQGGASDSDYSGVPANVVFDSGDTEKTFSFSATTDSVDDDGESVKLGFGTLPTDVTSGSPSQATVNITDVPSVNVSFENSSYTVDEGISVTVKVKLDADPERTVTIPLTKANQGGATAADYSGVPANVVFDSGDTEKTFSFTAATDSDNDDGESVKLGFGSTLPTGVSAGSAGEHHGRRRAVGECEL